MDPRVESSGGNVLGCATQAGVHQYLGTIHFISNKAGVHDSFSLTGFSGF